jgi:hypothetical protein
MGHTLVNDEYGRDKYDIFRIVQLERACFILIRPLDTEAVQFQTLVQLIRTTKNQGPNALVCMNLGSADLLF